MTAPSGNAPAWLFAFVDLAFLLLLAMTQLGGSAMELGEIVVPRIGGDAGPSLTPAARELWQLRVHPPALDAASASSPYELVAPGAEGEWLGPAQLRDRLEGLRAAGESTPLLAPHADSRSQDLLEAVALLEEVWPSRRRATVERLLKLR